MSMGPPANHPPREAYQWQGTVWTPLSTGSTPVGIVDHPHQWNCPGPLQCFHFGISVIAEGDWEGAVKYRPTHPAPVHCSSSEINNFFKCLLFIFEREREQGRVRKKGRHRIQSRLQALSCQYRARRGAQTHKLQDHDPSRSRTPNRLSHPGAFF